MRPELAKWENGTAISQRWWKGEENEKEKRWEVSK